MFIQPEPPFEITRDPDGAAHAVKEQIQVTVTADCGDAKVNHRVGSKPETGEQSRWLHVDLENHGLHIFVSGTHVVVTGKNYLPGFDLQTPERLVNEAMKRLKPSKDAKGRYVVDTPENRAVLMTLADAFEQSGKNRLIQWVKYAVARLAE